MKSALRSTGMTVLVFALLGSAQLAASSGDGDTGTLSLERPGTGTPVCGLGREFHAGRRAELRKRVEQGLLLFRGLPDTRGYTRFHQDKVFWYLTGVESPNSALLMDAKSGREILFVARADRRKESWEGEVWDADDEWVRELSGFEEVLPITELEPTLAKLVRKQRTVWVSTTPWVALAGCVDRAGPHDRSRTGDAFDGRPSREERLVQVLEQEFKAKVKDVSPILDDMRRVKTVEEIAAMRRAGRAGGLAIAEAMRSTHPDVGEWELEALMTFVQIREGAAGPAYHGIVGSGANSNVLHYSASARRMQAGEVILVDYGPEVDHYTTDITRTWPVSGSFTPEMAEMYDAVLAAQAAGIAAVKPGATMREISRVCSRVLRERGYGDLIRHGACHYIGLEVHDVGARSAPFEPGVAFTVEPGIYDDETGIGIRIEDVVIVTEDGCEIVSGAAPKDRKLIEALMRERGLMDGMADRAKSWRK